ncbi:uncharacterized protein LOC131324785 isoform X2 [Rhododendron vialii]|uniref:uncharacterized protein LOC131324785 isoform X2 n=1 Tax=Rhododendron vialii TaxID=182163 RepID=UPI00265DC96A|nr:uncharacterized protein LOC131324785 isoform X2 [Rhododendron vialii]
MRYHCSAAKIRFSTKRENCRKKGYPIIMPRSSGGGRGSFSSAYARSDTTKNVATSVGLSSMSRNFERLTGDSSSCQVVFDLYEECMTAKTPLYGASTCNFFNEMRESCSCSGFKRDPHRRSSVEIQKEWEKNTLRRANAAGFATIQEYYRDENEKDPAMCNIAFELYNKCIRKNPGNEALCNCYRNNCKQFKS